MTEMTRDELRTLALHARRRSRCHHAQGNRCECECGGTMHKLGHVEIPADILAEIAPRTSGPRPRRPRRRRHNPNSAQLHLVLP